MMRGHSGSAQAPQLRRSAPSPQGRRSTKATTWPEDTGASWAASRRAQLREDWLTALTTMAELHAGCGEHGEQEALLRSVLRADPYHEHSYRALMTLRAAQGRRAEALALYHQLEGLLCVQFGASAAPETQALAARIRPLQSLP
jgi:DNA-binding SARP family transcriptional activator